MWNYQLSLHVSYSTEYLHYEYSRSTIEYRANDNHHIHPIVYLLFFFVSFSKDRCGITYRFFILRSLHAGPYRPCTVVTDVETWWSASWWPCCCEFIRIQATKCCKNCCHWRWNLKYSVAERWIQKKWARMVNWYNSKREGHLLWIQSW